MNPKPTSACGSGHSLAAPVVQKCSYGRPSGCSDVRWVRKNLDQNPSNRRYLSRDLRYGRLKTNNPKTIRLTASNSVSVPRILVGHELMRANMASEHSLMIVMKRIKLSLLTNG